MSGPIVSGWVSAYDAFNAIPNIVYSLLAKAAGREAVSNIVTDLFELHYPGFATSSPKRAYFAKTARDANFLIDVQWALRILSDFFYRPFGFYRGPNDTIFKMVQDPATGDYVRTAVEPAEWLKAEDIRVARVLSTLPEFKVYGDVEVLEAGESTTILPKRAGLTPFECLRRFEPISALAQVLFGFASIHSVASTVVPCFIPKGSDFTVSGYLCSQASRMGSDRYFSPEVGKGFLDFAWNKADSALLTLSYGLTAAEIARKYFFSPKNRAVDPVEEGIKFISNVSLALFHGWSLLTKQSIRELRVIGRGLGIAAIVMEEVRKQWQDRVTAEYNLNQVVALNRTPSTNRRGT